MNYWIKRNKLKSLLSRTNAILLVQIGNTKNGEYSWIQFVPKKEQQ